MRRRSKGAALLAAMLTVTLVATFAAAALWQQWRSVEVEAAERTRVQSAWILGGALDWARLILREDARTAGGSDHLGEPWAVPLQESRLSTFLAADAAAADTEASEVFLSGEIIDLQSRLNVQNLFKPSTIDPDGLKSFERLFAVLGLPASELPPLAENFRFASDISVDNLSAGRAALAPASVDQLVWLGLSPATVQVLKPFVAILPGPSSPQVNVNTASAEVIYAASRGLSLADAQRLVAIRRAAPFRRPEDIMAVLPGVSRADVIHLGTGSNFFEVRGRLRLHDMTVEERSVVERRGLEVFTRSRERGVLDPAALALQQQEQAQRR